MRKGRKMSDNKFTESMEVEAVGNLKSSDIGWGTCDGCEKNIHKFQGVLIRGVTPDAAKLLFEKVEVVPVGTTERLKNLEGINDSLVAAIKAIPGKPITEDWVFAEVEKGIKAFSEKYKELKASNKEMLEENDKLRQINRGMLSLVECEQKNCHCRLRVVTCDVCDRKDKCNLVKAINKAEGAGNE